MSSETSDAAGGAFPRANGRIAGSPWRSDVERFWAKVRRGAADECWLWTASKTNEGYGRFRLSGKARSAHVVSWLFAHGGTGGMFVLHRCDTPLCVNPAHLFLGSHEDNMRDMAEKGRAFKGGDARMASRAARRRPPREPSAAPAPLVEPEPAVQSKPPPTLDDIRAWLAARRANDNAAREARHD